MGGRYNFYTYIKGCWTYLSLALDLYSKKIIGYTYTTNMTNELIMTALERAYSSQKPDKPIILHTDLGSQYTSNDMKYLCEKLNIIQSFSKK